MVRLYAMTKGRARSYRKVLDVIALVTTITLADHETTLTPEQAAILSLCRTKQTSVAEIAAGCDLPLSVVRVLLTDLLDAGHIRVDRPAPPRELPSENILREVINGLRAL
jgi:hypothetical protein